MLHCPSIKYRIACAATAILQKKKQKAFNKMHHTLWAGGRESIYSTIHFLLMMIDKYNGLILCEMA